MSHSDHVLCHSETKDAGKRSLFSCGGVCKLFSQRKYYQAEEIRIKVGETAPRNMRIIISVQ